jgi:hypothetical protein
MNVSVVRVAIREEWFLSGRLAEADDNRCGNLVSVDGKSD